MVLVCENPLIEKYLAMVLRRNGQEVMVLEVSQAIRMVKSGEQKFSLLITNTPAEFRQVAGDLPFLYLSASPDPQIAACFPRIRILQKPFTNGDLITAVNEMASAA